MPNGPIGGFDPSPAWNMNPNFIKDLRELDSNILIKIIEIMGNHNLAFQEFADRRSREIYALFTSIEEELRTKMQTTQAQLDELINPGE